MARTWAEFKNLEDLVNTYEELQEDLEEGDL